MKSERINKIFSSLGEGGNALLLLLRSYLLTGIFILVPVAVTLFIFWQLFILADGILGDEVSRIVGYRLPGIGLITTALVCLFAGMIAQNVIGRRIVRWMDISLESLPVVRTLYVGIKQVADVLFQSRKGEFKRVVLIEYPKDHSWALAFVTNDFTVQINDPAFKCPMVTVFVPTTPNPTSGFLLITEKSRIIDTTLDIEEAMKIVISGGLVQPGSMLMHSGELMKTTEKSDEEFTIPH